jgi:hypothetical protein
MRTRRSRPLTKAEIQDLRRALGSRVDPDYLAYWVSEAIEDAVRSVSYLSPRELRDSLRDIEHCGRRLLRSIDEPKVARFLRVRIDLASFRTAAVQFCDDTAALIREVNAVVGPGRSPTSAVLAAFIDRMIGIAKRAKVLPKVPSRRANRKTVTTPPFFKFLQKALRIGQRVIQTSKLSDKVREEAVARLQYQTRDALIGAVIRKRGKIRNYRPTLSGLVESDVIGAAVK